MFHLQYRILQYIRNGLFSTIRQARKTPEINIVLGSSIPNNLPKKSQKIKMTMVKIVLHIHLTLATEGPNMFSTACVFSQMPFVLPKSVHKHGILDFSGESVTSAVAVTSALQVSSKSCLFAPNAPILDLFNFRGLKGSLHRGESNAICPSKSVGDFSR